MGVIQDVIVELQDVATKLDASPPQVAAAKPLVADAIAQLVALNPVPVPVPGAHRYWHIRPLSTVADGARIEISELGLGDAVQVALTTTICRCAAADLTGIINSNADKQDCRKLSDGVTTDTHNLLFAPGATPMITQDFGTPVAAVFIRQGRHDDAGRQVKECEVSYSDDGVTLTQVGGTITLPTAASNFTMAAWVPIA